MTWADRHAEKLTRDRLAHCEQAVAIPTERRRATSRAIESSRQKRLFRRAMADVAAHFDFRGLDVVDLIVVPGVVIEQIVERMDQIAIDIDIVGWPAAAVDGLVDMSIDDAGQGDDES